MNISSVFYAEAYHPIQAGSIDGTDIHPHDNAVCRALLCSTSGLYDPFGDPKATGDPYCTLFVGRLSHSTTEETLCQVMSEYGKVKNLRLVRHIVTGASRGYAFVEFETEREMRRAYMDAHHTYIDGSEIMVDYSRQQLMPGWIPRRLGGGLGGKKESGQLRFGGRERPFRAPLRKIPYDDLKRLGIPAPPEGRYLSRFEVPSPPRRKRHSVDSEDYHRHGEGSRNSDHPERSPSRPRRSRDMADNSSKRHRSRDSYQLERSPSLPRRSRDMADSSSKHRSNRDSYQPERSPSRPKRSRDRADNSSNRHRIRDSYQLERSPSRHMRSRDGADSSSKSHRSRDFYQRERSQSQPRRSRDRADSSSKRHRSSRHSGHEKRSHSRDPSQHRKSSHSLDPSQLAKQTRSSDRSSEDTSNLDKRGSRLQRSDSRGIDWDSRRRNSTPDE